jgi:3-hydroxyacyl-CoA dehydrogenase/enoyl-CoA hydratase/3-hydroxybutyryl-CoA epimerase
MNILKSYEHWSLQADENDICWLYFDKKGENANTLSSAALDELSDAIATAVAHGPKGLIIASAKKSGFIAGADVREIQTLQTPELIEAFLRKGQGVCKALSQVPFPTLAYIQGFCLGGGLELSLSCDYRIAEDRPDTKIGLPEVLLGILPGWGGTVRLPRLTGVMNALEMMLTGKTLRAKAARAAGIVDECLPERVMKLAAVNIILNKPPKRKCPLYNEAFRIQPTRALLAMLMRKQVQKRAKPEHYPSPFAIIDNWEKFGSFTDEGFEAEIRSLSKLACNDTTKNLIRIFFLQEKLKDAAKKSRYKAKHVHVIGAGTMGGDIATWCAMQGLRVTLQDTSMERIGKVVKKFSDDLKKRVKDPIKVMHYRDLLTPDVKGDGIPFADVIIEAVFEDLEVKQTIFRDAEARAKQTAILATNTSSIPLDEINTVMSNPGRLVGIHFFNPVAKMQLVEVIHGQKTDEPILQDALSFVLQIKKLPLSVKSAPGFLVNRCLTPYLLEAVALYDEGVSPTLIDKLAVDFGMPMGPIELADIVGLDICLSVADHLKEKMEVKIPEALMERVKQGNLGKKSGKGFYAWTNGKPTKPALPSTPSTVSDDVIQERLVLRFINEAMACLREGIVETADNVDAGIIFGTGFAPFRGGPLHYAESVTPVVIERQLSRFEKEFGERFRPDLGWKEALVNE